MIEWSFDRWNFIKVNALNMWHLMREWLLTCNRCLFVHAANTCIGGIPVTFASCCSLTRIESRNSPLNPLLNKWHVMRSSRDVATGTSLLLLKRDTSWLINGNSLVVLLSFLHVIDWSECLTELLTIFPFDCRPAELRHPPCWSVCWFAWFDESTNCLFFNSSNHVDEARKIKCTVSSVNW